MNVYSKIPLYLLSAGLTIAAAAPVLAACVSNDCSALGYTKTESYCDGDIIRCPFDTSKVFCKEKEIDVTIPCTTIGAIYNNDKTCTSLIVTGKTPVGIIYGDGQIINIFGTEGDDHNWEDANKQCNNLLTGINTKGWRLPTMAELRKFPARFEAINNTYEKLGVKLCPPNQWGQTIYACRFWSSESQYPGSAGEKSYYKTIDIQTGSESYDQHNLPLGGAYRCIKSM